MGIKAERGNPVQKDRFHLLEPQPIQVKSGGRTFLKRNPHPWFRAFNEAPPEERRTVIGQIVHQTEEECWQYNLKAQQAKGQPMHPRKRPFCVGDGERAERYMGLINGEHRFDDIICPNDRCEFRIRPRAGNGLGPAACKPWGQLLFRLGWRGGNLPTALCKFTTRGWYSVSNGKGFFESIHRMAVMVMGYGRPISLGGFTFTLTLGEKTNPEEQTRFPVVTFAPLSDPVEFFMEQCDREKRLEGTFGPALPAPIDLLEVNPEQEAQDLGAHEPGVGLER